MSWTWSGKGGCIVSSPMWEHGGHNGQAALGSFLCQVVAGKDSHDFGHKQGGNEAGWGGHFVSVNLLFTSDSVLYQCGFLVPTSWSNIEKIGKGTQKNDTNCWKAEKILHEYISRILLCMWFYSVLITIVIQTPFSSALRKKAYSCTWLYSCSVLREKNGEITCSFSTGVLCLFVLTL